MALSIGNLHRGAVGKKEIAVALKPGVHIIGMIAAIAIAQKEFSDQNDCMETVRSAIVASQ